MTVTVTCRKCGYRVETDFEAEAETRPFVQALRVLAEQAERHTHDENFKWRLGWSSPS